MTKILYCTDQHYTERTPRSRRDNFGEAIIGKVGWSTDFGNEQGVDVYLEGGDLFNYPVQTPYELNRIHDALERRKAPTYGVIGNHPIKGNFEGWRPYSGVEILQKLKLIDWLDPWEADIEVDGFTFRLHHTDLMRHPIVRADGSQLWPHITWDEYDPGEANVVLISHYHPCQGSAQINGVWFISPGAVSRGTLAEDNLSRAPGCTLITIEGGKIDFERIEIPHEPAEAVFDERSTLKVEEIESHSEAIQEALEVMKTTGLDATTTPIELLRIVHSSSDASDRALELAIEKIQEVGSA